VDTGRDSETASRSAIVQFSHLGARSRAVRLSALRPGESVTTVFLEMLNGPLAGKVSSDDCALCHRVLGEEVTRLRELAQRFQGAMFPQWMKRQGGGLLGRVAEFLVGQRGL
jgi:hypothetical protein